jgi:hypothetical protein
VRCFQFQDVSIICTSTLSTLPSGLVNNVASEAFNLAVGESRTFTFAVQRGDRVTCVMSGDIGTDVDLHVRWDNDPTTVDDSDCSGTSDTSDEICSVTDPGGASFLAVKFLAYTDVSVELSFVL